MNATGTTTAPTWAALAAREPRLTALLTEAKRLRRRKRGPTYDAYAAFYGDSGHGAGFKGRLSRLVGWDRRGDPLLGTEAAYDLVYDAILTALGG